MTEWFIFRPFPSDPEPVKSGLEVEQTSLKIHKKTKCETDLFFAFIAEKQDIREKKK